ncbi:MAG: flagellar motor protein [Deltaproteobacteria bacterium]|nr:flagellar motor protein [Deltaproteobacteria bacterium]
MAALSFLIFGFAALVSAFILEGGHVGSLFVLTAAMIVFGGTISTVGLSFPTELVKKFPSILKKAFSSSEHNVLDQVNFLIDIANIVRREGVLVLERMLKEKEMDRMTRTGLQLVADGIEPELIRSVLESYIENAQARHKEGAAMFDAAGGFAPTMGIIGTVMGLVHVLGNLSDPGSLGPAIAVAFIATLYGVGSANLIWLPLASRLKVMDKAEAHNAYMVVEGITLIATGISPRIVEERLQAYLEPHELEKLDSRGEAKQDG